MLIGLERGEIVPAIAPSSSLRRSSSLPRATPPGWSGSSFARGSARPRRPVGDGRVALAGRGARVANADLRHGASAAAASAAWGSRPARSPVTASRRGVAGSSRAMILARRLGLCFSRGGARPPLPRCCARATMLAGRSVGPLVLLLLLMRWIPQPSGGILTLDSSVRKYDSARRRYTARYCEARRWPLAHHSGGARTEEDGAPSRLPHHTYGAFGAHARCADWPNTLAQSERCARGGLATRRPCSATTLSASRLRGARSRVASCSCRSHRQ